MDVDHPVQVLRTVINEVHKLFDAFRGTALDHEPIIYKRVAKLLHLVAPLLTVVIFYQYMKYLLILNAYEYEESVKRRSGYVRKLSRQLRLLTKRYGNFYFCYMPMNHGTMLPPTNSLFSAIKEVLVNANRPGTVRRSNEAFIPIEGETISVCSNSSSCAVSTSKVGNEQGYGDFGYCRSDVIPNHPLKFLNHRNTTRIMRTNLLMDLVHGERIEVGFMTSSRSFESGDRDLLELTEDEEDPLSEINLHIMKCSRELIIQGVKDFDVMSTVYRVMETATGEEED